MNSTTARPASDKQVAFARDLYREIRDLGENEGVLKDLATAIRHAKDDRAQMSVAIDVLITRRDDLRRKAPRSEPSGPDLPDVPDGRYAVEDAEGFTFWQVDRPEEGKWAGWTFVKSLHGSPGDLRREPVRGRAAYAVLERIYQDPVGASYNFGRMLGICGICGSPLTNEESRELGIGPVCREKMGW